MSGKPFTAWSSNRLITMQIHSVTAIWWRSECISTLSPNSLNIFCFTLFHLLNRNHSELGRKKERKVCRILLLCFVFAFRKSTTISMVVRLLLRPAQILFIASRYRLSTNEWKTAIKCRMLRARRSFFPVYNLRCARHPHTQTHARTQIASTHGCWHWHWMRDGWPNTLLL